MQASIDVVNEKFGGGERHDARKHRNQFRVGDASGLSFAVPDHESGGFAEGHLSLPSGVLFHVGTDQIWDALHGLF